MSVRIQHLHTFFHFPFSVDRQAVLEDHCEIWRKHTHWMHGLEAWLSLKPSGAGQKLVSALGGWKRSPYSRFDIDSIAYQDMVFFHPFVRRVFFDSTEGTAGQDSLLQFYRIPLEGKVLWFEAEDIKGRSAKVQVTDFRLHMYANGIGILSIGVEAHDIPSELGLWINEMMRKIYPSSGRQIREARAPSRLAFTLETPQGERVLIEERFGPSAMVAFHPPLEQLIQALLYFGDYSRQEYEPVLDERMVVYTYVAVDPASVPEGYIESEDYQILLSHLLYVDRAGPGYRYDAAFVASEMRRQVYRRWAHQGTYYGFTSYSNVTLCMGQFDCDEHQLREGFLIHRMFTTRYFLMAMVTLFYRATLLDFAERTALVSRRLFQDQESGRVSTPNIRLTSDLRSDFLHFSNYWYFGELANKDEENEHFLMQVRELRVDVMQHEVEEEVDKLNVSLHNYFQYRNTEAVNRLAMLSLILGGGAVITGFFGMNFGGAFNQTFFDPGRGPNTAHYTAILAVAIYAVATLTFGLYVVVSNWQDYRESLLPRWWLARKAKAKGSLRRS